jgi:hypothetical protein
VRHLPDFFTLFKVVHEGANNDAGNVEARFTSSEQSLQRRVSTCLEI